MDQGRVAAVVAPLGAAVDALLDAEVCGLSAVEVSEVLAAVEVQRRRLAAVDLRLLAEVTQRGLAGDYAATGPAQLLVDVLRVSPAEARTRLGQADDLGPRRALSGEMLDPLLPAAAEAVRLGEISTAHVGVIRSALGTLSPLIGADVAAVAEQFLVDAARNEHPRALARTAELLMMRLDPDGREPREDEIERRRGFTLHKRADGSAAARGEFTAELTAIWETIFDSLAAPLAADTDGAAAAVPDQRTAGQRRHDALAEVGLRLLRSDTLPAAGGAPVTILIRTTLADLMTDHGSAQTAHGDLWSVRQVLRSACEAALVPVGCTEAGGVMAYGRTRRLASRGQRLALIARDGGCCFPGCDRPAAWSEVHHIREWADSGPTDIDNMCLVCRFHHREFARSSWQVQLGEDGVPEWIPPAFLDPSRTPVRNTAHRPHDLTFTPGAGPALPVGV